MAAGEVYGKYRLIDRIASGGMGEVFRAVATGEAGFEKPVAIKRLHVRFSEDEELVLMLQDEAKLVSLLNHPNICQVLDLGRVGDTYYMAMEFVEGKDLMNVLKAALKQRRPLPIDAAIYIAGEMLAGLDYAHRKRGLDGEPLQIIHRDVSPQNVLLTYAGQVKIIDFGIAKAASSSHRTQAGIIKGKFRYMSPEQARGEPIDHRTDIFATGVVLYEMITGRPHSPRATDREILIKMQQGKFTPLGQLVPDIHHDLEYLVHKALAVNLDHRYSSGRAFRKALADYRQQYGRPYGRDQLAHYLEQLFQQPSTPETAYASADQLGLDDLHLQPPDNADPFAPQQQPILSSPRHPLPGPPQRRHTSPQAATVAAVKQDVLTEPTASNETPMAAAATTAKTDLAPRPVVPERGKAANLMASALRGVIVIAILGATAIGSWMLYQKLKKPSDDGGSGASSSNNATGANPVKRRRVERRLPPTARVTLSIKSRPKGARIFLNGKDTGRDTPADFPEMLAPNPLPIELRHKRFKNSTWKRRVPVGVGDHVAFVADLRNPPKEGELTQLMRGVPNLRGGGGGSGTPSRSRSGSSTNSSQTTSAPAGGVDTDVAHLNVIADIKGATVLINGKARGKTPFYKKVRPSTYTIQVRYKGKTSSSKRVTIKPGKVGFVKLFLGL